ncbi:hypothetical protein J1TS3_36530 [Siminovitchia fordii]|uniref:Uncharacterized protein n=1 Tax=Siminovitchia fordii TaxID=254759 RepID=A0ABQ4K9W7_9BACI|nr:hypothetical protein J1TS3_36530 [Siminovitchia fordii]
MHSKRYLYWPIKIKWSKPISKSIRSKWFHKHGWQVGWDGFAMGVFGWTYHLGRLKICFGNENFKKKPHKQKHIPIEDR